MQLTESRLLQLAKAWEMPPVEEIGYWAMYEAAIAAAPQPEQVESEPVAWMNTNGAFNHMKKAEQDALHAEAMSKLTEMVRAAQKPQPDRTAELEQLRQRVAELEDERDAALARLSEERDIWDGMLGDAADKIAHLELELDDCLYVLDALWDKQCN